MEYLFGTIRLALTALPFLIVMSIALFGFWAVVAVSQRPLWGAWALAAGFLVETWFIIAPQVSLGLRVSSTDLAVLVLLGGLAGRVFAGGLPFNRGLFVAWLAVGAVLFASFGLGLVQFGTKAGVEVRENFYFWVAATYFASYRYTPDDLRRFSQVLHVTAWGVVAIALYRWIGLEAGFVSRHTFLVAGASSEFRAVGAHPTLVVGVVGVMYFARWLDTMRGREGLLASWFLGFAVVFQHRSVWLALLAMLFMLLWLRRERLPQALPWLLTSVLVSGGMLGIALAMGYLDPLASALETSVTSVTSGRSGTHTARIDGWLVLLGDWVNYTPRELFFGKPYGTGFARFVAGRLDDFSPHNFYVELLLRIGLIGLTIWILVLVALLRAAAARRMALLDAPGAALALAVMTGWMVFYTAYQGSYFQGAGYGLALALAMAWANEKSKENSFTRVDVPVAREAGT